MGNCDRKYATRLGAGLGLIDETKSLLSIYEENMDVSALVEAGLQSGLFPNITARRLRNIVAECFSPRYIKTTIANHLKPLSTSLNGHTFNQFLFIHTALANEILLDFIVCVYWPRYSAGANVLTIEDARVFVEHAV